MINRYFCSLSGRPTTQRHRIFPIGGMKNLYEGLDAKMLMLPYEGKATKYDEHTLRGWRRLSLDRYKAVTLDRNDASLGAIADVLHQGARERGVDTSELSARVGLLRVHASALEKVRKAYDEGANQEYLLLMDALNASIKKWDNQKDTAWSYGHDGTMGRTYCNGTWHMYGDGPLMPQHHFVACRGETCPAAIRADDYMQVILNYEAGSTYIDPPASLSPVFLKAHHREDLVAQKESVLEMLAVELFLKGAGCWGILDPAIFNGVAAKAFSAL